MIHDGFKVAQTFELHGHNSHSCYGILYMVTSIAHMTFTFMQTFFVFKNHQVLPMLSFIYFGKPINAWSSRNSELY